MRINQVTASLADNPTWEQVIAQIHTWPRPVMMQMPGAEKLVKIISEMQGRQPALASSTTRVTLLHQHNVRRFDEFEQAAIMLNRHHGEQEVSAWIAHARLTMLPVQYKALMVVELETVTELKKIADLARKAEPPQDDVQYKLWTWLWRIGMFLGRDIKAADWDKEAENCKPSYAARGKSIPPSVYAELFIKHARKTCRQLVATAAAEHNQTLSEWWASRYGSTPSGSSSMRHLADKQRTKYQASSDRANKRIVWSMLPDDYPQQLLQLWPKILARCSTKNEPGLKNRALYAADDNHTILAAYASAGMERACEQVGLSARQSPATSHAWAQQHAAAPRAYWLSADYSDFNKEHRWWEQALLNVFLAKEWERHGTHAAKDKARATWHVARSYTTRLARANDKAFRPTNGLFSGERNTARDNTILHKIYSDITLDLMGGEVEPKALWVSGDDEDGLFRSKDQALKYCAALQAAGWHLNPIKQLHGYGQHEFLQVRYSQDRLLRPLAPLAISLVSWSWYKPASNEMESLPKAAVNHVKAVATRGGDAAYAWALHRKCLNNYFQYRAGKHVRWDALLADSDREFLGLQPPPTNTDHAPTTQSPPWLEELNTIEMPGRTAYWKPLWPLLEMLPVGQRKPIQQAVDRANLESWFRDWSNKNPPYITWARGKTPKGSLQLPGKMPPSLELRLAPQYVGLTKAAAAAMAGVPLPLVKALEKIPTAFNKDTKLLLALTLTDNAQECQLLKDIKRQLSVAPWI